ncbi:MAG: hypothetical protein HRU75_01010 [Planctomycetia bacterium]|nr:MAG: hypothetical protein HRU75_01010 [Planctomycetia bacterium]
MTRETTRAPARRAASAGRPQATARGGRAVRRRVAPPPLGWAPLAALLVGPLAALALARLISWAAG